MQTRKNGMYYFRRVVPEELRDIIGKKEIVKSLKTKDYKEAKKRDMVIGLQVHAQFEEAWKQVHQQPIIDLTIPTAEADRLTGVQEMIDGYWSDRLESDESFRVKYGKSSLGDDMFSTDRVENNIRLLRGYIGNDSSNRLTPGESKRVSLLIKQVAKDLNLPLNNTVERLIVRRTIQHFLRLAERSRGVYREDSIPITNHHNQIINNNNNDQQTRVSKGKPKEPKPKPTLTTIIEEWQKERNKGKKTYTEYAAVVKRFYEVVGGEIPIDKITPDHVRAYKQALLDCPSRPPMKLKRLPLPEMIKKADRGLPKMQPETITKNFNALKTLLNFAVSSGYIDSSPGAKVTYKPLNKRDSNEARLPFTTNDIKKILGTTKDMSGSKFWIPRLALYVLVQREMEKSTF